jgi:predicted nucleotidyltransferase
VDNKIPEALPVEVRAWLSQASQTLIDSLSEDLESLILFGSAAEGLMRASSDVNLLVGGAGNFALSAHLKIEVPDEEHCALRRGLRQE